MIKKVVFLLLLALPSPSAVVLAQQGHRSKARLSMTFQGETLSEALRRIDLAQNEKHILFLFDDLELFTVSVTIDRLPVADAVRRVCDALPVSVTEEGDNIFVEYVPKIVRLNPVVVDGERVATPPFLLVDSLSDDISRLQQYARHIVYFNHVCPQEKVYLHLDNTAYFQGETIWFAANVVSAMSSGKTASKVLYVELLSPTGVVLKQQKLKIVDGRCHGSFPLVDAEVEAAVALRGIMPYPSGYYQIRAYTRAQLNFDEAGIFSRVIPVYRAPEQEGHYDNPVIATYDGPERDRPDLPRSEQPKDVNVTFYPEGGHLIEGVPCRIAFKVTDENGMGLDVDAVCDDRDHVIPTTPLHKGMGAFVRVPGKGTERLSFIKDGRKHTFALPKAEQKGCAVRFGASEKDVLTVAVEGMNMDGARLLGYTITSNGQVMAGDTVALRSDAQPQHSHAQLGIPKKGLPTGVCQFTLFDAGGAIYAQRLFFVDNGIPTVPVTVERGKEDLRPFAPVSLRLHTDVPATFSLAVRDAADYGTAYRDDIRTYMLLSSELKGLIEDPAWYFDREQTSDYQTSDNSSPKHSSASLQSVSLNSKKDALDLLMMVQGWTRYNWRQMAGKEPFPVRHYTEEQLVVDGWAFSRILERPLKNTKISVVLYSPDRKLSQKATVTTDSLGYWSVGLDDFDGEWDLFLASKQPSWLGEKATTRIRFERSSRPKVTPFRPEDIFLPDYKNEYPTIFTWQKEKKPIVSFFPEPGENIPFSFLIDDVVVEGKRRYVDYERFHAFDAHRDTEMDLDEGNYTHDVAGYLQSKGYTLLFMYGGGNDSKSAHFTGLTSSSSETGLNPNNGNSQWLPNVVDVEVEGHRTKWSVFFPDSTKREKVAWNEWRRYERNAPADRRDRNWYGGNNDMFNIWVKRGLQQDGGGWSIDMEHVKSVLVFDYQPGHRFVEVVVNMKNKDELRHFDKNYRHTTFAGYSRPVQFYAPSYPKGPIEGDKDYRRTLYWNPEVTTDSQGNAIVSFYNNGYSQTLSISAEGLTKEGIPIIYP